MQFINLISSMKMLETKILDFYMVYLLKKLYMVYGLNCWEVNTFKDYIDGLFIKFDTNNLYGFVSLSLRRKN